MDFPTECPGCKADLTKDGAVTAVYEDYIRARVTDDGLDTGEVDCCGDSVRAFCTECGEFYLFNEADHPEQDEARKALFDHMVETRRRAEKFEYWGENDMFALRELVEAYAKATGRDLVAEARTDVAA